MFKKIKETFITIFKKLESLFYTIKKPEDWSSTSFISVFCVVVPILIWSVLSAIAGALLAMPPSILAIVIAGITGKVVDKKHKLKNGNGNGK